MILNRLFGNNATEPVARRLYVGIVAQARRPAFYERLGVPDTLDGRFEMVALHTFLVLHRLKQEPALTADLAQQLFDTMFLDMDGSLREMGAGDLGVGPRVQKMATGFYGRIAAYEAGLRAEDDSLSEALRRNVYGTVKELPPHLPGAMGAYLRIAEAALAGRPIEALLAGEVEFPAPDTIS